MENILSPEYLKFFIYFLIGLITIINTGLAIQWRYYKQKIENLQNIHEARLDKLTSQHHREFSEYKQKTIEENQQIKKILKEKFEEKKAEFLKHNDAPLIQEVKMVYVKYLHIRRESEDPVYQKYINRLEETIDVNSEFHYYRFNKYNKNKNSITITDRSSGIVDQNILHPWKKLTFTDIPSQKVKGIISQDVGDSDAYFSVTTYYNGFKENNEDIGMKMEMDTLCARMIADFSSIIGLKRLFVKEPDAYKIELNGSRIKLLGLEKIAEGVYHLVAYNLKKGESLLIDFHVNWNYLNDE